MEPNRPNPMNNNNPKEPKKRGFNLSWLYMGIIIILLGSYFFTGSPNSKEVSYTQLQSYIQNDIIEKLTISDDNTVQAHVRPESVTIVFGEQKEEKGTHLLTVAIPSVEEFNKYMTTVNLSRQEAGKKEIDMIFEKDTNFWIIMLNVLPFLIFILFFVWMSRGVGGGAGGAGIFNVGKARAQVFDKENSQKVTFKDVAGLAGAKQEVEEIVAFLKNPKKYTTLGGKIPKGALLVGPPGTGKTLLAKAVAGEADVPFFSMSGSDFVEMFVGVGASRVRDLFRQAKEKAPAIVFIDEIDAVGRARGKNIGLGGGNDERESTLNQLLTEMDGFGTNSGVIILAATNRADVLDSALLRAGRFDRQIHVELPDVQERKEIFGVHLRPIRLSDNVDVNFLAKQTPGFSGADIANVCNEAALIAARKDKQAVDKQDFMDAVDRIIGGLERKTKIMTDEEKRSIAFHEAGHATISWMLRWANPLVKVTIVPRGIALGAAWYMPEERQLTNREHLLDEMCATLGGRAAEEIFMQQTSTGALNDLERVTKQAYAMVAFYGMSDNLPNLSYYDSTGKSDYGFTKPYSEKTAEMIDKEVGHLIAEQMKRAKTILEQNAEGHHRIAQLLIEKEVITADDVEAILGPRPWKSRQDEIIEDNARLKAEELLRKREEQRAAQAAAENNAPEQPQTEHNNEENKE